MSSPSGRREGSSPPSRRHTGPRPAPSAARSLWGRGLKPALPTGDRPHKAPPGHAGSLAGPESHHRLSALKPPPRPRPHLPSTSGGETDCGRACSFLLGPHCPSPETYSPWGAKPSLLVLAPGPVGHPASGKGHLAGPTPPGAGEGCAAGGRTDQLPEPSRGTVPRALPDVRVYSFSVSRCFEAVSVTSKATRGSSALGTEAATVLGLRSKPRPEPADPCRSLEGHVGAELQSSVSGDRNSVSPPDAETEMSPEGGAAWRVELRSDPGGGAEAPARAAALTLGKVTDVSPAPEQVPAGQQGVERGGEAGGHPDHDISQQVDLSLQAAGRGCQCHLPASTGHPQPRKQAGIPESADWSPPGVAGTLTAQRADAERLRASSQAGRTVNALVRLAPRVRPSVLAGHRAEGRVGTL